MLGGGSLGLEVGAEDAAGADEVAAVVVAVGELLVGDAFFC